MFLRWIYLHSKYKATDLAITTDKANKSSARMKQKRLNITDLIDQVYDAALDPDEWDGLIHQIQTCFSSHMAGLFMQDTVSQKFIGSYVHGISDEHINSYDQHFSKVNPWFTEPGLMTPGRVLTERSINEWYNDSKHYTKTEYYNDWAKEQDYRHAMGGMLLTKNNVSINFTLFRSHKLGYYTEREIFDYNQLNKHLSKAVTINKKLQQQNFLLNATNHWVDKLQFGIILLDRQGKVLHCNRYADKILKKYDGLKLKNSYLKAMRSDQDKDLQKIIQQHLTQSNHLDCNTQNSLSISRPTGKLPYSLILVKIKPQHEKSDFFNYGIKTPAIVVFISDPQGKIDLQQTYLLDKYEFTDKETMLVISLLQGNTLKQSAILCGLKYETARWYLKSIFDKTQTNSQSELMRTILLNVL
ncbi:MAG: hypothetical protein OEY52_03000 [Gammaproteobacteria bacterium]|nr:hypothetical protein [Gammaproteobacteria bacterium]